MKFIRPAITHFRFQYLLLLFFSTVSSAVFAQKNYPQGYFLFPIRPGQVNYLSGNMGELRPNHFHAGLDIKTQAREGLPVYASADGYVSRIKIAWGGYGNALYITHPNGLVTVYGHLKSLNKKIGNYLKTHQYIQKTFEIELMPDSTQLRVKRGDIIALSGNTGGSGGPHLHYEIRDLQDNVLNPEYFGFKEIKDNVPPIISKLALVALQPTARVRGEFGRTEIVPTKAASNVYLVKEPVPVWGKVGLELLTNDLANNTSNRNGVSCIEVKLDDKLVFSHHLETFSFDVSRSINVHVNYDHYQRTRNRFQRCYVVDGNQLGTYKTNQSRGAFDIRDEELHTVSVSVWDAYENVTQLRFWLKGMVPIPPWPVVQVSNLAAPWRYDLQENTLLLKRLSGQKGTQQAYLYIKDVPFILESSYQKGNDAIYLWDMRRGLPDSVSVTREAPATAFNYKVAVPSRKRFLYEEDSLNILFDEASLFDTLYLETARIGNLYQIGRSDVPLANEISVRLKPDIPAELRSQTAVYEVDKGRRYYVGGIWVGPEVEFKTKFLGTFTLAHDDTPPYIKLEVKSPSRIVCRISDGLSGIGQINAYLNGQWLLMQYDYKTGLVWSDPLDSQKPLKGDFVLEVSDKVGNVKKLEVSL